MFFNTVHFCLYDIQWFNLINNKKKYFFNLCLSCLIEIFNKVIQRSKEFNQESAVKMWIGPRLIVFLYDPRDVELILSSHVHIDKAEDYRFFKPWLGDGLLISTGKFFFSKSYTYVKKIKKTCCIPHIAG